MTSSRKNRGRGERGSGKPNRGQKAGVNDGSRVEKSKIGVKKKSLEIDKKKKKRPNGKPKFPCGGAAKQKKAPIWQP